MIEPTEAISDTSPVVTTYFQRPEATVFSPAYADAHLLGIVEAWGPPVPLHRYLRICPDCHGRRYGKHLLST